MKFIVLMALTLVLASCASWREPLNSSPYGRGQSFSSFLRELEREATAQGLNTSLIRASYGTAKPAPLPDARVAEKNQREFTDDLPTYLARAVNPQRVAQGRRLLAKHQETLRKVERKTGVPAELIVALWGMESDFGRVQGTYPLIPVLASMAYKSPRHDYFRSEFMAALQVSERAGQPAESLRASWAGAMGQCQFMPSNYLKYAADGNNDGTIDIWQTEADVFASSAAFLRKLGVRAGQPWRVALTAQAAANVQLAELPLNTRGLSEPLTLAQWQQRGLTNTPWGWRASDEARYYQPAGQGTQRWLVGPNYEAVLGWNYSSYFATSVWLLADKLKQ